MNANPNQTNGTLIGIGVGPGDPELLTIKASKILQQAKVVAYICYEKNKSKARSIAEKFFASNVTELPILMPMQESVQAKEKIYNDSAKKIAAHLQNNIDVIVLCEGDPFLYGSFIYLHQRLAKNYRCKIIAGISSIMASAAAIGQPLAMQNEVLTIVPATCSDEIILTQLQNSNSLVFIKIGRHLPRLKKLLTEKSYIENATYIQHVTSGQQKIVPLAQIEKGEYFSIVLLHKGQEK